MELNYEAYELTARQAAAEGAVLLKNEADILPLAEGTRIAVFGRIQSRDYKSGTGSGGLVNAPKQVNLLDALLAEPGLTVDAGLRAVYQEWEKEHPYQESEGWGKELWSQEEMPVSEELAKEMAAQNDAAIVIIGRSAGEDRDNQVQEGSYLLSAKEEQMLKSVCQAFERVIVLLNVGNIIDMEVIESCHPQAILMSWQCGMVGAYGIADVITGRVNPSGHLTDTIAYRMEDYPSSANFGDWNRNVYAEDIYVGYRYFETFAPEKVRYPFGYGLSYTSFAVKGGQAAFDGEFCFLSASVTNTGKRAGKCVLQAYASAPQGSLGKPAKVLVGFLKTELLLPGQTENLIFTIDKRELSSYDDSGVTGYPESFVLEAGTYHMYLGENVRDCTEVYSFTLSENTLVEECEEAMKPQQEYARMKPVLQDGRLVPGTEQTPVRSGEQEYFVKPALPYTGDQGYVLGDVLTGKISMEEFIAQLTEEELFQLVRGEGLGSPKVTAGTAGAFGGVSERLKRYGVPCGCCSDGPSGLRLDSGAKAFSMPNGTMLACTFNRELVSELFSWLGREMRYNKVDTVLGPGMNIHRNPLNGRNFEYLSEDPYVTGWIASAELEGLSTAGVTGTLKHFCCNNQESNRYGVDAVVSERALREIYLRGFEIAVREGGAYLIMTTYGRVNGLWTSNDAELTTGILREQWYFDGCVMTDWWAAINDADTPEQARKEPAGSTGNKTNFAAMVRAQNDIFMVCPDGSKNDHGDNLAEALSDGRITRDMLAACAEHILGVLLRMPAMERMLGVKDDLTVTGRGEDWKLDMNEEVVYYEVAEDTTIPLTDVDTSRGCSFSFGVKLNHPGGYVLELTAKAEGEAAAQVPVTIYSSGIPMTVVTFHGTNGAYVTETRPFVYLTNFAVHRLYFSQNGLTLDRIRVRYVESLSDALEKNTYLRA